MKDEHNIILILDSPKGLILYSGGSSNSWFSFVHLFFLRVPSSNYHGDPSKSLQGFTLCSTSLSFCLIILCYRSSSWRLYMMVHKGFNSFSKFFIDILFRGAQAFFILRSEVQFVLSYLLRWCYVIFDNFPSCFMIHKLSRMRYFKSINLVIGVILVYISPKAFPRDYCYLWCL